MQVLKPDYFIHVGIYKKDKHICSCDFSEVIDNEESRSNKESVEAVIKYLELAIEHLKKAPIF
jgi:hypothetical protein